VIVYFGQFFENYRSSPHFCTTFSQSIDYVLILTNNALGYILGDFFINPSGHPGDNEQLVFYNVVSKNWRQVMRLSLPTPAKQK
jgi:hypothetical protein